MKKITAALLVLTFAACKNDPSSPKLGALASGSLIIKGEIAGADTGILEVMSAMGTELKSKPDTITLEKGKFTYTTNLTEPTQMAIRRAGTQGEELVFFADPGDMRITAPIDSIFTGKVEAGPSQKLYKEAEDSIKNIMEKGKTLYQDYVTAQTKQDGAAMQRIQQEFGGIQQKAEEFAIRFSVNNKSSVLAPYLALMYLSDDGKQAQLKSIYDTLDIAIKDSYFGKKIGQLVKAGEGTSIGAKAADFSLPDTDGKIVSLSSFKGKYVLLDFWASWCGPCRRENPNVVTAYNNFKAKGFDILSVSLDRDKDEWLKAIKEDGLIWTHISDLKYWDCEPAKLYGIQAIPANFLLDKDGKIIGKNLRGEELEAKLKEIMP